MPTNCNVKVNTIGSTVRGNSNMVELTGYDATNRRGFKKLFFETKKDGGLTRNAETAQALKQDDWVEITMDDTTYKNVQSIRVIAEPTGENVPSQAGGGGDAFKPSTGGGGGATKPAGDRMSKAEWAAKDAKKALDAARCCALEAAVALAPNGLTKANVAGVEKLTDRFTVYLITGDFDGHPDKVVEVADATPPPVAQVDNTVPVVQPGPPINEEVSPADNVDDIPF